MNCFRSLALFVAFSLLAFAASAQVSEDARRRSVPSGPKYVTVTPVEGGYFWVLYQYADEKFALKVYEQIVAFHGPDNVVLHTAPAGQTRHFIAQRLFLQVVDTTSGEWEWWSYSECCPHEAVAEYFSRPEPKGMFTTPDKQVVVYWKKQPSR